MATIVIAEDHPIVREGIRAFLTKTSLHEVVAECGDGLTALTLVAKHKPDILVVDLQMPGLDGLEVTRRVVQNFAWTKVVVLSMHASDSYVSRALQYGALAYVLKSSDIEDLNEAIDSALKGKQFLSRAISDRITRDPMPRDRYDLLTSREREVFQLVAEGSSAVEIAKKLYISVRTVEKHRSNLMHKLELRNQAEVIKYALQRGLIPLSFSANQADSAY